MFPTSSERSNLLKAGQSDLRGTLKVQNRRMSIPFLSLYISFLLYLFSDACHQSDGRRRKEELFITTSIYLQCKET